MNDPYQRIICIITAALIALTLSSCRFGKSDDAALPESTTASATADESAPDPSSDELTAPPSPTRVQPTQLIKTEPTAISYTTAPAATAPSAEDVMRSGSSDPNNIYDAAGFVNIKDVIPEAQTEIRYASDHNFVGTRINGYEEPVAIMTKEAAVALMGANNDLKQQGYTVKIFDAYRPQRAVDHFVSWSYDSGDQAMKSEFYPDLDKSLLFSYGYIASYSGHSHGSTIDLTLVDLSTGEEVDMGGSFDYFGSLSHPDYSGISSAQYQNRMTLRNAMINNGFSPLSTEWWHFSLNNDPYPYTYFDFPVSSTSLS